MRVQPPFRDGHARADLKNLPLSGCERSATDAAVGVHEPAARRLTVARRPPSVAVEQSATKGIDVHRSIS